MSETPVIGLSMIVKNEEATIRACLESVLPHVDRAVILDTGSTDQTRTVMRDVVASLGLHGPEDTVRIENEVIDPWSFAAARNRAWELLLETYPEVTHVLWLDSDDVLRGGEHLRSVAVQVHAGLGAGMMHYHYASDPWGNLSCSHFRERLIRVDAAAGWVNAVHEVMALHPAAPMIRVAAPADSGLAAVPTNSWPIGDGGIEVIHHRPAEKDTGGRNREILEEEALRLGDDTPARVLFYLGQEYAIMAAIANDGTPEGVEAHDAWLEKAVDVLARHERVATWDEERYQARHRRADFLRALRRHQDALNLDLQGCGEMPDWPDAWLGAAESYVELGQPAAALAYVDVGLARPYPDTPLILNPLDYTFVPAVIRARAALQLGRLEEARRDAAVAARMQPTNPVAVNLAVEAEEAANRRSVREAVLALDEALARHDENLKAVDLLENCVPYFLELDAEIADRRRRRRAGVRHVRGDMERYGRYYGEDNPVPPISLQLDILAPGLPFPEQVDAFCRMLPRAQFIYRDLIDRAEKPLPDDRPLHGVRVLDIGCNDGWLGWWLASLGADYTGFDMSEEAIRLAVSYADRYPDMKETDRPVFHVGTGPPAICDFDVVVCFEVIEHVPDVARHLEFLSAFTRPGGRVYVSTPNGAYERGRVDAWNDPQPRGHVRAITTRELAATIRDLGATIEALEETPDRLVCAAFTPGERPVGHVAMYLGAAGQEVWSPTDSLSRGLGGSETMAVRVATALTGVGWRVTVYGNTDPQMVQGVEYLPYWMYDPTEPVDVLISSRHPGLAAERPNAAVRVLWLHDAEYPDLAMDGWDHVVHVGAWQERELWGDGDDPRRLVIPNAIPLDRYAAGGAGFSLREPWVVYSSSPDRGLETLLNMWPRILEQAPTAKLHVTYGFTATWRAMEAGGSDYLRDLRKRIEGLLTQPGVVFHGSVGQLALAELQQKARVWAYPTDFPEVSCITGMEAQAAGLAIVATAKAELPATLDGSGATLFPPTSEWGPGTADGFATRVATLLTVEAEWVGPHVMACHAAARFDVRRIGGMWDDLLRTRLEARS